MSRIEASLYAQDVYGLRNLPRELLSGYGYALLTLCAADHLPSDPEKEWLARHLRLLGAPEAALDGIAHYDYDSEVDDFLPADDPQIETYRRMLLYDAIRMSEVGGMRYVPERFAEGLGLDATVTSSVEQLVRIEAVIEQTQTALYEAKTDPDSRSSITPLHSQVVLDTRLAYARAMMVIAGADGEVSPAEKAWLTRETKLHGFTEEMTAQWQSFDYKNTPLDEALAPFVDSVPFNFKRMLLHDAIQMARADRDFHQAEKQAVHRMAGLLGIGQEIALSLLYLVQMQEAAAGMRKAIFGTETY